MKVGPVIFFLALFTTGWLYYWWILPPLRYLLSQIGYTEAEFCARQHLTEILSAKQLKQLMANRLVVDSAIAGYHYRISQTGQVSLRQGWRWRAFFCIAPLDSLPPSDWVITMLRQLQCQEEEFIRRAGVAMGTVPESFREQLKQLAAPP